MVVSEECELVTLMSVIRGRFELTTAYLYFFDSRPGFQTRSKFSFSKAVLWSRIRVDPKLFAGSGMINFGSGSDKLQLEVTKICSMNLLGTQWLLYNYFRPADSVKAGGYFFYAGKTLIGAF